MTASGARFSLAAAIGVVFALVTPVAGFAAPVVIDGNGDGVAQLGERLTYTFTVTNEGNAPITNPVIIDRMLAEATPAVTVTCAVGDPAASTGTSAAADHSNQIVGGWSGDLAIGDTLTCTGAYVVTESDVAHHDFLVNVAMVTAIDEFGDPVEPVELQASIPVEREYGPIRSTPTPESPVPDGRGGSDPTSPPLLQITGSDLLPVMLLGIVVTMVGGVMILGARPKRQATANKEVGTP